jgi:hypothetical protein
MLPQESLGRRGMEGIEGFAGEGLSRTVCKVGAEVFCISECLEIVTQSWSKLEKYFEVLLSSDFIDAKNYVKLLFDDENFTYSQKYFWSIGCLTEFITSISDTVLQWDLYYEARILPVEKLSNVAEQFRSANLGDSLDEDASYLYFQENVKRAKVARETLVDLRTSFTSKLETAKALRDGVRFLSHD